MRRKNQPSNLSGIPLPQVEVCARFYVSRITHCATTRLPSGAKDLSSRFPASILPPSASSVSLRYIPFPLSVFLVFSFSRFPVFLVFASCIFAAVSPFSGFPVSPPQRSQCLCGTCASRYLFFCFSVFLVFASCLFAAVSPLSVFLFFPPQRSLCLCGTCASRLPVFLFSVFPSSASSVSLRYMRFPFSRCGVRARSPSHKSRYVHVFTH